MKKYFLLQLTFFFFLFSYSQTTGTIKVKKTFSIVGTWYFMGQYDAVTNRNITLNPYYFDTLTYYSDSSFIKSYGSNQNRYTKCKANYSFSSDKIEYTNEKIYTFSNDTSSLGLATTVMTNNILYASNDSLAFIYYFPNTNNTIPEKVYYYKRVK